MNATNTVADVSGSAVITTMVTAAARQEQGPARGVGESIPAQRASG